MGKISKKDIQKTINSNEPFDYGPRNFFYTEREWSRAVGWGQPEGMNSFDRAKSTGTDSPKDD